MSCPLCGILSTSIVCPGCTAWYTRVAGRVPATPEEGEAIRAAVAERVQADDLAEAAHTLWGWYPGQIPPRVRQCQPWVLPDTSGRKRRSHG